MVCGKEASTGGVIATSANQIVPPKFRGPTKMLYYIHQTPLSFSVSKGGLGTRLFMQLHACCVYDALQSSRESTNPILNQSVVEKLFPSLN